MQKIVLITGTSSGIGLETAKLFHRNGWKVIATMREPEKRRTELHEIKDIDLYHLDILDQNSIDEAVEYIIKKYGQIDVLVNNAGYELFGSLEDTSNEQIIKQFNTNIIGPIYLIKKVVPHMRKRSSGCIINLSSIAGKLAFPIMSMYHSTKHAVEGLSKSIWYELKDYNIRVKLIEPGLIHTNFYSSSFDYPKTDNSSPYKDLTDKVIQNSAKFGNAGSHPLVVANTIYKAAISNNFKLHYSTGKYAKILLFLNGYTPGLFRKLAYTIMSK